MLIPVPALVVRKASALGIYYTGLEKWGKDFADDLGDLFEAYIGRQLGLLPDAVVLPEIAYGKQGERSVDWFVIFDDCVVLVEVKSTRPSEPVRLADDHVGDALKRVLGKAIQQLNKSAKLILERHPGFTSVPADRPLVGLIVTMEPFHTVNTPFTAGNLPAPDIPYRICSASELEHLVTVTDMSIGRLLMGYMTDAEKTGWSVRSALSRHVRSRNAILDTAWATLPWKDEPHTDAD